MQLMQSMHIFLLKKSPLNRNIEILTALFMLVLKMNALINA